MDPSPASSTINVIGDFIHRLPYPGGEITLGILYSGSRTTLSVFGPVFNVCRLADGSKSSWKILCPFRATIRTACQSRLCEKSVRNKIRKKNLYTALMTYSYKARRFSRVLHTLTGITTVINEKTSLM